MHVPLTSSVSPGVAATIAGCRAAGLLLQFTTVFWAAVAAPAPARPAAPAIDATATADPHRRHICRAARINIQLLLHCDRAGPMPCLLSFLGKGG
ncbi:hypothetical protein GCM10017687_83940 [Streptomyces echinatus]